MIRTAKSGKTEKSVFIVWDPRKTKLVYNYFLDNGVRIIEFQNYRFENVEARLKFISHLYRISFNPSDPRVISNSSIDVFLIECPSEYQILETVAGPKWANFYSKKYKNELRELLGGGFVDTVHCTDEIDETNIALRMFGWEKYSTNEKIIDKKSVSTLCISLYLQSNLLDGLDLPSIKKQSYSESVAQNSENMPFAIECSDGSFITRRAHGKRSTKNHEDVSEKIRIKLPDLTNINAIEKIVPVHIIRASSIISHREQFNILLRTFRTMGAKYFVVRGHEFLPKLPNTDLDIFVEPGKFDKITSLMAKFFIKLEEKTFSEARKYIAYATNGSIDCSIPNGYFRMDMYSGIFFPNTDKTRNWIFEKPFHKIAELINFDWAKNVYVPDLESGIIFSILRAVCEKGWHPKYQHQILQNAHRISPSRFHEASKILFKHYSIHKTDDILEIIRKSAKRPEHLSAIDSVIKQMF